MVTNCKSDCIAVTGVGHRHARHPRDDPGSTRARPSRKTHRDCSPAHPLLGGGGKAGSQSPTPPWGEWINFRVKIQAADPKTTVAEVARDYGFEHFSYFARDYRALFAEYPSETLLWSKG